MWTSNYPLLGDAGLWLHTVAELKFADQVHAVAVLPGCAPKSGQAAEGVIVAAVGRRLVAFSEQHGQLQKHHLTATAQPVTCLSPGGDTGDNFLHSGLFLACCTLGGYFISVAEWGALSGGRCANGTVRLQHA